MYQVKDVHARVGLNYPSFVSSFDGTNDNDRYLRTILFLEGLLQHYSLHSVLPKVLVYDLATGCFYPGLKQHFWVIHLRKAQAATHRAYKRAYLAEDHLRMIQTIPALSYFDMTDDQLCLVTCTIQQLLVEHALYLQGPMTMALNKMRLASGIYHHHLLLICTSTILSDLISDSSIPIYSSFIIIRMVVF